MLSSLIALCFIQDELLAIVGLKILNRHFLDDLQSKNHYPIQHYADSIHYSYMVWQAHTPCD